MTIASPTPPKDAKAVKYGGIRGVILNRLNSKSGKNVMLTFGGGIVSRLGFLSMTVLLARQFGPDSYGIFVFATTFALIAGQLTTLGWPILMNRLIPVFTRDSDWELLRGLLRSGDYIVILVSFAVALVVAILAPFYGIEQSGLAYGAILLPITALTLLRRQQLIAMRKSYLGMMLDQGFGAIGVTIIILIIGSLTLWQAIWAYNVTTALAVIITTVIFRRLLPAKTFTVKPAYRLKQWMVMASPLVIGQSAKLLMTRAGLLLLAPLSTMTEVGLYGAASRFIFVLSFLQTVLIFVITPMISEAFAHGKTRAVRRLVKLSLHFTSLLILPIAVVCIAFSEQIVVLLFGEAFRAAAPSVVILMVGQTLACYATVYATVLMMGGRERAFAGWNIALFAVNIALCVLLIPRFGGDGAAWASTIVSFLLLVVQWALARPLLRREPMPALDTEQ